MNLEELLAKLTDIRSLTRDNLANLESELVNAASERAGNYDATDELEQIVDGVEQVRNEIARRDRHDEMVAGLSEEEEEDDEPVATTEDDGQVDSAEPEVDDDAESEGDPANEPADQPADNQPSLSDLAAERPSKPSKPSRRTRTQRQAAQQSSPSRPSLAQVNEARPSTHDPQPTGDPIQVQPVAGTDVPGYSVGQQFPKLRDLGEAFAHKAELLQKSRKTAGMKTVVASLEYPFPEDRQLIDDSGTNMDRIWDVVSPEAITAAGGRCAPLEPRYELAGISSEARPLRDTLARFNASRGGVTFIDPPRINELDGAVDIWTEANDQSPSDPATKPCLTVECGTSTDVSVSAVTKCIQIGNFQRRFFPEQFNRFWQLAGAQHAREAENQLWNQMCTLATAVTTGEVLGAMRDVLENLDHIGAIYRSSNRMAHDATLEFVFPHWLLNLMRADVIRQHPGDDVFRMTDQDIFGSIRDRNFAPTPVLDGGDQEFAQQGAGALINWPDTVEVLVYHPGAFLFLDGGSLDFGMEIRDSTLNSTNDVQAFMETFEEVALVGVEAWCVTFDLCPSGSSSIAVATDVCTSGS